MTGSNLSARLELKRVQKTWLESPTRFVTDVLGVTPEVWQAETLDALGTHDRISVRSGHGVGKSALDSWAILWFMATHFPVKACCVAPSLRQIEDVLWTELAIWHKKMPDPLRGMFNLVNTRQNMRFEMKGAEEESFAVARAGSKDNPEALQGLHQQNMLFIIDEASGVDDIVFEVGKTALSTPGAKMLLTSNPTRTTGYFYDTHHRFRDRWWTKRVSCFDSTRVSQTYIDEGKAEWGEDSNIYRVRVLGEFPDADDDAVIPLEWVEDAQTREVEAIGHVPVWGVDVARYGNCRTALAKRKGNTLIEPVKSWQKRDLMEVSGLIAAEYEDTPKDERPYSILIDSAGLGAGVVDRCREVGLPARGINVGESASGRDRYANLKAELWWKTREWFGARDCKIPVDNRLSGQLASVRYKYTSNGKIQIESKEQMMERGLPSPDEADAFVLTMMGGAIRDQLKTSRYNRPRRNNTSWMAR